MLRRFCVENFKVFDRRIDFDLGNPGNYEFNSELIQNGVVSKSIIYGFNGCGKSALGMALFDITSVLTDNNTGPLKYEPYRNMNVSPEEPVCFYYEFVFDGNYLEYFYKKKDIHGLLEERLTINGEEVLFYNHELQKGSVTLPGAETLKLDVENSIISRVKYVRNNALLTDTPKGNVFRRFMDFVDRMLLFYTLDEIRYRGFTTGNEGIAERIIKSGKVKEFEQFLKKNNVDYKLKEKVVDGIPELLVQFKNGDVNFFKVASTGTRSMALFFCWYIRLEQASLAFMDEFDAFYHFELSENIVTMIKPLIHTQVIMTTHNTDLLSNDLLRPDCYYWLDNSVIKPLSHLTEKELRRAHNLQKMFKAGAFT